MLEPNRETWRFFKFFEIWRLENQIKIYFSHFGRKPFSREKKKREKRGGCRRSPRRLIAARPAPTRLQVRNSRAQLPTTPKYLCQLPYTQDSTYKQQTYGKYFGTSTSSRPVTSRPLTTKRPWASAPARPTCHLAEQPRTCGSRTYLLTSQPTNQLTN